jgi:adenine-specific DNA-methyltransferase
VCRVTRCTSREKWSDVTVSEVPKARKARGAFFTPEALCQFIARWAIESPADRVLEPSAGEAAFLLAAGERLRELGGSSAGNLSGVELHAESAANAYDLLSAAGHSAELQVADFFSVSPKPAFDAVIGNPPYVRYQDFTGASRALSHVAAMRAGVRISNLASSWAAFTVHAALFLRPGGRLGLVLPAELLSVNYAAEVRRFLMQRFGRVRVVVFTERVFPGVLEEVVLLLAEAQGPTDHCELVQVNDLDELCGPATEHETSRWSPKLSSDKWTDALAPRRAVHLLDQHLGQGFTTLQAWGETTLGMVTGANKFFAISPATADRLRLTADEVIPLSPPGSRHLRSLTLTPTQWLSLGAGGSASLLFRPSDSPSPGAKAYIREGEVGGVHEAYKCRIRKPWWRVPLLKPADLLLTYMNADTPRLCANSAGVHHLNSVHGIYLRNDLRRLGTSLLPLVSLNSLTALGAELVGRSYGGGMLKLEPREADRLAVPSPQLVEDSAAALRRIKAPVTRALQSGAIQTAVEIVDQAVLVEGCGLDALQVDSVRYAVAELRGRRTARGGAPRSIGP